MTKCQGRGNTMDFETHTRDTAGQATGRTAGAVTRGVDLELFWILDNISSLHQITPQQTTSSVHLYKPRDGYRTRTAPGLFGPMIEYYLPATPPEPVARPEDPVLQENDAQTGNEQALPTVDSDWDPQDSGPGAFFRTLKELVVVGYYASEMGATQELRMNPMGSWMGTGLAFRRSFICS